MNTITWTCTECKYVNVTIANAYNFFCDRCKCRHSDQEILSKLPVIFEV